MFVSNNKFILLCTESLSMDVKIAMVGFILYISLALTALAESPPMDDYTDCVKPKPTLCPKNEERGCRNPCPPETCMTLYAAFRCIQNQTCVNGCYCKPGFLRIGPKGPCVPRDQCNPLECVNDPNARKGCGDKCGKTCTDYKSNPICPKRPCKNDGCECKEGYIYDLILSLCVKPKDCTKPCKPHERYSTCLLSECLPKTCDDVGQSLACPGIAAVPCPGGCICNYGYVKDKDGNCVDAKTCPSCGGDPNAQAGCGNPCGKTCASLNANKSNLICPRYCESNGCDCKEGYLLNTNVKPPRCVLVKDCPKPPNKCGKNEEFYCGPSCPASEASCSNPNPPTCFKRCELKCFCKKGFVRDANKACIPANKCPKQCPKPHERYSNCVLGECVPKTCDDLGKPLPCPDIAPPCAGGCICEQGYVRDKNGNCINAKSCPSCGGDPNAESGCSNPCGQTCANLRNNTRNTSDTYAVACATYCLMNGCDCKKGYILNTDVNPPRCVLPEDCNKHCVTPKPNLCPKNEERGCRNPCPPETCMTLYAAFLCIQNQTCVNGCYCKPGFLRIGQKGPCVPRDQCNPLECVNDPNAQKGCGDKCGKTCADYKSNPICPKRPCKNDGCECKEGYIYDQNLSLCVKPKDCTKPCKHHERYSTCLLSECLPKTCDDVGQSLACPGIAAVPCPGGCICDYGYVKGKDGNCVDAKTCPSCGGDPNAQAGCGNSCGKTCASLNANKSDLLCPQYCESNGCDCKEGYLLNTDVKPPRCVLVKDCPKPPNKCGKNEEFYCGPSCPDSEASCSNPNPPTCFNKRCELKCFCKKGYVRDANNACIPANKCPNQCPKPHERYSNCVLAECVPKTCDDLGKQLPCPDIAPPCAGGCICEQGYVRDKDGNCINAKSCPCCGGDPNAESGCGNPCGQTCANLKSNTKNKRDTSAVACATYCLMNGCDCKKGYILNTDVIPPRCVLPEDCNKPLNCTKPNEMYIDCLAGQCTPKSCDDLGRSISCPFRVGPCPGGCICKEGYLRNSEGKCIKLENCPAKPCGGNQTWMSPCNVPCPYPRCPRDDKPRPPCVEIQPCYPGCQCKLNYLRNSTGHCILAPDCPPVECTRQYEVWDGCPSTCLAESCDDVNNQPTTCNTLIWLCSPRCVCKKGHFRNKNGLCVPASECPGTKCTKPNEQYIDCLAGQCKAKTCDELVTPAPCPRVKPPCPGGCICVNGYVRNKAGDCIKKEDCPKTCTGVNEQYTDCVNDQCYPRTCKEVVKMPYCPSTAPSICSGGCVCKRGFVRCDDGTCIAIKDCPEAGTCADPNQAWVDCAANCANAYCPKNDQPQPICFLPAGICQPGCKCKPNFRIDKNNNCIPACECPKVPCTRPNEEYNSCPGNRITSCALLRTKPVINTGPKICNPGCICKEGFYQNANGTCVPKCKCAKQCKGPHEIYIDCPAGQCNAKTCADLVTPPGCPRIRPPCPGGCVCEDGYLRDSKGICIKKEKCPSMQCKKPHERYSNCLLGECVPKTCDEVGYPVACPDIIGPCAGGCTCEEGFVRDCNGDCIDMKECPSCGGDRNAVSGCGNPCGKTCASVNVNKSDLFCPQYCEYNGCDCKPGFLLLESNNSDSKKCVPECKCPKPPQQCGVNEQYYCGTSCPEATCANPTPPTCVNKKCKLGCFCKKGFVRDANNKCVPVDKCPPKCKGPHEIYIDCPAGQCNAKTCKDLIIAPPCPRIMPPCPGGCVCEEGYLRDSKGICIKKEQCPQSCKANQTYVTCNVNCPDKYCPKYDLPQPVCDPPRNCPPGCTCKINYKYDQSGNCILASECPPVNCTGQNTEWSSCPSACLSEQCEDADSPPVVCNTLLLNCQPRCVCKKGHFRNKDGLCVPAKECPSVCKDPNASWTDCKDACPGTCQNTRPGCVNKKCSAGCQCNEGYVLSKIGGKCVKIETCADYADCCANQTFVQCTFKCPQVMCPESDQTILCKPPRDCPGGCGCKPYYRYNATGDCVKASDCPPVECTRPNEEWTSCQRISDWERCEDRYNTPPFNPGHSDDCTPKCVCTKGYWRDGGNKCVTEKECPPISE